MYLHSKHMPQIHLTKLQNKNNFYRQFYHRGVFKTNKSVNWHFLIQTNGSSDLKVTFCF